MAEEAKEAKEAEGAEEAKGEMGGIGVLNCASRLPIRGGILDLRLCAIFFSYCMYFGMDVEIGVSRYPHAAGLLICAGFSCASLNN